MTIKRFVIRPKAEAEKKMPEVSLASLTSRPTADQIERFAKLSAEERFHWLVDTLSVCHELATPEVRAQVARAQESLSANQNNL